MGQIFLITGDDDASVAEETRKILTQLVGPEPDEFSIDLFKEGDDKSAAQVLEELIASVNTPSFLGGDKTVCLQNFSAFGEEAAAKDKDPKPVAKALRQLAEMIKATLPPDLNLILSGIGIDSRKGLNRACTEAGKVLVFNKPEMGKRNWEREVQDLIRQRAAERHMRLTQPMLMYLTEIIGTNTGRVVPELEKLLCYAGEEPTMAELREICVGTREASQFALSDAFGSRNLNEVLTVIDQTLAHSRNADNECIGLTRRISAIFRRMLHVKALMSYERIANPRTLGDRVQAMSDADKAKYPGNECFGMHPFYLQNIAKGASNYSPHELLDILSWLAQFDRLNVSSSMPRRLMFETLAVRIITGHRTSARQSAAAH